MIFDFLRRIPVFRFVVYVLLGILALILVIIGLILGNFDVYQLNDAPVSGTIQKNDAGAWGIHLSSPRDIKIQLTNLPESLQQEGLSVNCDLEIVDVISGEQEWGVVASAQQCTPK